MRSDPNDGHYWTGGNDIATENTFTWVSGAAWNVPTSMWGPTQPDNRDNQDCIWIRSAPTIDIDDGWCSYQIDFICEYV